MKKVNSSETINNGNMNTGELVVRYIEVLRNFWISFAAGVVLL